MTHEATHDDILKAVAHIEAKIDSHHEAIDEVRTDVKKMRTELDQAKGGIKVAQIIAGAIGLGAVLTFFKGLFGNA